MKLLAYRCLDNASTVMYNHRHMDVVYRRAKLNRTQKERIARDYNAGMAITAIMTKYDIARSTLYKVLQDVAKVNAT